MALLVACSAPGTGPLPTVEGPIVEGDSAYANGECPGGCPAPLVCGAQDLGWYRPEPGVCGLGCTVVAGLDGGGSRCGGDHPIEHACPYVDGLGAAVVEGDYACRLVPAREDPERVHFCCGL